MFTNTNTNGTSKYLTAMVFKKEDLEITIVEGRNLYTGTDYGLLDEGVVTGPIYDLNSLVDEAIRRGWETYDYRPFNDGGDEF